MAVAGIDRVDNDAEGVDVVHLGEMQTLVAHLVVDAVEMLFAPDHVRNQLLLAQLALDAVLDLGNDFLAVAADLLNHPRQHAVAQRVERLEAELLEFETDRVHAQALGDRRIDFQRLARDAATLGRFQGAQRAHVVQAVGELDENDADIIRHRHQHLLEVLRLRLGV